MGKMKPQRFNPDTGQWEEITEEEFIETAEALALRILNSYDPARCIPAIFVRVLTEDD